MELRGKVTDSRLLKLKEKVGVNLYLLDETYHDSLLVKGKPNYVSQTDEEGNFRFTNLAEGNYLLTAVSQGKGGTPYSYNPAQDKFAFHSNTIKIPSDSLYNLFLYQQEADYKINRPEMIGENQIRFAYQGNNQLPEIELQEMPSDLQTRIIKETDKDTLYFWYHPILERDSLEFKVISRDTSQILKLKRKEDAQATKFKLHKLDLKTPQDTVSFRSDTPLKNKDEQFISLVNQDSTSIEFKTSVDLLYNTLYVIFEKDYESNYQLQLLPGAVTDWQGVTNDSLEFNYRIRPESDFGSLHLNIQNITHFPVRVDLLNDNSKLIRTDYLNEERSVDFLNLSNGTYFVRLSYDLNKNRKWDTGNFKKRIQPEPVFFFHIPIEVHPNWSVNEVLRVP